MSSLTEKSSDAVLNWWIKKWLIEIVKCLERKTSGDNSIRKKEKGQMGDRIGDQSWILIVKF